MVGQGLFQFLQHGVGSTRLADEDDGLEAMTEAPEILSLSFGELHRRDYTGVKASFGMH